MNNNNNNNSQRATRSAAASGALRAAVARASRFPSPIRDGTTSSHAGRAAQLKRRNAAAGPRLWAAEIAHRDAAELGPCGAPQIGANPLEGSILPANLAPAL
jgi:hypothetical protein